MPTLLLRLEGPMQSWGTQSRFTIRDTGLEPSKSGVVGLLCAALGKPRDESHPAGASLPALSELAALKMGVRIDREGVLKSDYHTAQNVAIASGGKLKPTELSRRYYLSGASFLVGLEGAGRELLERLDRALAEPRWQLFLGRKSFVPAGAVRVPGGLSEEPLREALLSRPWVGYGREQSPVRLRLVWDADADEGGEARQDVPISFAERRFTLRYVRTEFVITPSGGGDTCTSRD
jgi:CRISPR system Cascade subunit CasD